MIWQDASKTKTTTILFALVLRMIIKDVICSLIHAQINSRHFLFEVESSSSSSSSSPSSVIVRLSSVVGGGGGGGEFVFSDQATV